MLLAGCWVVFFTDENESVPLKRHDVYIVGKFLDLVPEMIRNNIGLVRRLHCQYGVISSTGLAYNTMYL
jgi:hypothetical protein